MTNGYDRRLRKLEATHRPEGGSIVILGVPGWPEPSSEEIGRATKVLRVKFISAKHGQQTGSGNATTH